MAVQQGRSERSGEAYSAPYGEPRSDARTPLADFFSILLAAICPTLYNPLLCASGVCVRRNPSFQLSRDLHGSLVWSPF
jgi:hypothetical protein